MTLCQLDISYMTVFCVFFSCFITGILIFILMHATRETCVRPEIKVRIGNWIGHWIQFTDKKIDEMYYAYSGYLL